MCLNDTYDGVRNQIFVAGTVIECEQSIFNGELSGKTTGSAGY